MTPPSHRPDESHCPMYRILWCVCVCMYVRAFNGVIAIAIVVGTRWDVQGCCERQNVCELNNTAQL
jgi:hypothetical protein